VTSSGAAGVPNPGRRRAAVLIPLYRDAEGDLRLVLIRRAERGAHAGQIALPGGRPEPVDGSLEDTARREAWEEIGLDPQSVEVLEALPALETRTSGFVIAPFLSRIRPPERWRPDPAEVAEVLEPRVRELAAPESHGESLERFPDHPEPRLIPFYRVGGHRLWGITYRIVHPLVPRLVAGEWPV
jgi:8-oxo-dGTP pyrophosphatase MutT (NUDIX family)